MYQRVPRGITVSLNIGGINYYHTASMSTTRHQWLSHCIIECHVASLNTTQHQLTQHQWTTQTITEQHIASLSTIEQHWTPLCITECWLVWRWCQWFYSLSDRHTSPCVDSEFYQSTAGPVLASVLAPAQLPVYTGKRNPYHKHTKIHIFYWNTIFSTCTCIPYKYSLPIKKMECSLLKSFMTLELTHIVALVKKNYKINTLNIWLNKNIYQYT